MLLKQAEVGILALIAVVIPFAAMALQPWKNGI